MPYNFRRVDRDQVFLLPPSVRDWLPADHLANFVIDAVGELPAAALAPFLARYRADGTGATAYHPVMMATLLLYAYATGERSSRRIEALCRESVAYRVITANAVPDHVTIARFRARNEAHMPALFDAVVAFCAEMGMGSLGLLAIDGTKIAASASREANRTLAGLDARIAGILAEAAAVDAAEDAQFGPDRRGDELPPELADPDRRLERLREARRRLEERVAAKEAAEQEKAEARAAREADGKRTPGRKPPAGKKTPEPRINTTDPESRLLHGYKDWVQGYNAQAAATEDGLIVAADLVTDAADYGQLVPMVRRTAEGLAAAAIPADGRTVLLDGGYWNGAGIAEAEAETGMRLLVKPWKGGRQGIPQRTPPSPARVAMTERLAEPDNLAAYARRPVVIETIFAHLKEAMGFRRFMRRGKAACHSEWLLACTAYNLRRLCANLLREQAAGA